MIAADDAKEDLFEGEGLMAAAVAFGVARLNARPEFFKRAVGDEMAAVDDGDVGAETLDDLKDVGGEEDGGATGDHPLEHGLESARGDGVDAFKGLVEEEDAGPVDDGCGQGELFLHAVGEVGDEFFRFAGEAHKLEQLGGAGGGGGLIEAVHPTYESEVFRCSKTAEEGQAFGDDADLALDVDWVRDGVEAKDLDGAGCRGEEASKHLDGGGFACSVWAKETKELAGSDREVDVLNRDEVAETTGEACGGDGGDHVWEAYRRGWGE